jgi:Raf kinase inhibitor-like YbhB/YbcL family protein
MKPFLRALVLLALPCAIAACETKAKDGGDGTPPEVDSMTPANGATASVSVVLSATFSEPLDPATMTENTFRLTSGGTLVPGGVAYTEGEDTATFTPTAALSAGASYTAQILSDVTDEAGNELESAFSWGFSTSSGEFVLSSTQLAPGGVIAATFTCDGVNVSPDLTWTAGPPGTLSYAMTFIDQSNDLTHWSIWDITTATTTLNQGVPNDALPNPPGGGAKQIESYDSSTFGYLGPCPPSEHTYQFKVYAIDVATLPGVTTASTAAQVETAILQHDLGSATLTGTYDPP